MVVATVAQSTPVNPSVVAVARLSHDLQVSSYRLASGNRIHSAGDDAASVAAATQLQSQISTLRQGQLNGSRANSLLQVATHALTTISDLLETLEGLAVEADSGALTESQRSFLDTRFQDIVDEIDRIATTTRFGDKPLLDGSFSPFQFPVGDAGNVVDVTIDAADTATLFGGATPSIATRPDAVAALPVVQDAREAVGINLAEVTSSRSAIGANDGTLANAIFDIDTARGALVDTDIPFESARKAALLIRQQVGVSVTAQTQALNSGLLDLLTLQLKGLELGNQN